MLGVAVQRCAVGGNRGGLVLLENPLVEQENLLGRHMLQLPEGEIQRRTAGPAGYLIQRFQALAGFGQSRRLRQLEILEENLRRLCTAGGGMGIEQPAAAALDHTGGLAGGDRCPGFLIRLHQIREGADGAFRKRTQAKQTVEPLQGEAELCTGYGLIGAEPVVCTAVRQAAADGPDYGTGVPAACRHIFQVGGHCVINVGAGRAAEHRIKHGAGHGPLRAETVGGGSCEQPHGDAEGGGRRIPVGGRDVQIYGGG